MRYDTYRARLPADTYTHQAMLHRVNLSASRPPDHTWKRQPRRPRDKWTDQLHRNDNNIPAATLWRRIVGRGHPGATLRSALTIR